MNSRIAVSILLPLMLSFSSAFGMKRVVTSCSYKPNTQLFGSNQSFNKNLHSLQDDANPHNYDEKHERKTQLDLKKTSNSKK